MSRLALALLMLILLPDLGRGAEGETLYLRDGRELPGISQGLSGGMLRWETIQGETITIPLDDVERIEYAVPASDTTVATLFGDGPGLPPAPGPEVTGENASSPDLPSTAVDGVATDGGEGTVPLVEPVVPGRFESAFGLFGARVDDAFDYSSDWTKRFEIGGRTLRGNTDEDFFNSALRLEQKTDRRFAQIDAGGQFSQRNREPSSNRWFVNGTMDFNKQTEERWVWFATSKNEYDEFENLSYRGSLSTGLGYRFFKEPKRRLIVRFGPGVTYERFYNPTNSRVTPDLFGEVEALWPLFDRTSIEHKTSVYPSMEDMQIFRSVSTYGLLIGIDEAKHWALNLGLRHEYNSQPNNNREKSDYTATFTLVYTRN